MALSTLLGQDNQPGELDGHGPIPATPARHLANDPSGTWRRLVTDPLGTLIDYGRTVYEPPTLRECVIARDRTYPIDHTTDRSTSEQIVVRNDTDTDGIHRPSRLTRYFDS